MMTKVLYFDIETAMMQIGAFSLRNNDYVSPENITQDWFIFMISYADISHLMGEKQPNLKKLKVENICITDKMWRFTKDFTDDYYVVKKTRDILESADILIAHNGDRFDLRKFNARLIYHGLEPLPPLLTVDTLKEARKVADFSSNKLSYLAKQLKVIQQKGSATGSWHKFLLGSTKQKVSALKEMQGYCDQDIRTGVDVYFRLRPYMKSHPNIADDNSPNCPKCNSDSYQMRGERMLRSGVKKKRYSCNNCGAWFTLRKSKKEKPLSTL